MKHFVKLAILTSGLGLFAVVLSSLLGHPAAGELRAMRGDCLRPLSPPVTRA